MKDYRRKPQRPAEMGTSVSQCANLIADDVAELEDIKALKKGRRDGCKQVMGLNHGRISFQKSLESIREGDNSGHASSLGTKMMCALCTNMDFVFFMLNSLLKQLLFKATYIHNVKVFDRYGL